MSGVDATMPIEELALDPFTFVSDRKSRIEGLGPVEGVSEGNYAFHTHYVPVAEGVAHFSVAFEGLQATKGTLNLRVHMLFSDSPHAQLATAERVALNRLILQGARYTLRFEAFHGVTYALYGEIIGDTDVTATALGISLDRPADLAEQRDIAAQARNTAFGAETVAVPFITSLQPPRLSTPVTQAATQAQLLEAPARRWIDRLGLGGAAPLAQWRACFLLEALEAYGMMVPGAHGAGLGCEGRTVPDLLASSGLRVDLVVPPGDGGALGHAGPFSVLDPGEEPPSEPVIRAASLAPLDPSLVNYDFVWTEGAADRFGSPLQGGRFIEATLACLRPGGIGVHLVAYDAGGKRGPVFARADVERVAMVLISRGHEVAEFRIVAEDPLLDEAGISACGIICRRAPLNG